MGDLIAIWAALLAALVIFAIGRPGRGGALTLAYFLGLSLIHVPGVLPFLTPGSGLDDLDETRLGFELTVLGMAAFVAGAVLARWTDPAKRCRKGRCRRNGGRTRSIAWAGARSRSGFVAYFVLLPLSGRVPSLTSVVSALATLLILGLWLVLYGAADRADWRRTLATLALLPLLPLATLVTGGFLGYGVYWVLSSRCLPLRNHAGGASGSMPRRRWWCSWASRSSSPIWANARVFVRSCGKNKRACSTGSIASRRSSPVSNCSTWRRPHMLPRSTAGSIKTALVGAAVHLP